MKKTVNFILSFGLFIAPLNVNAQSVKTIKKNIQASVEAQKENMIQTSDAIWEAAETSLVEYKSSKQLMDYARENGFEVTENVADIPTAFMAKYGSGSPVIGILGEFDANAHTRSSGRGWCRARLWS
jgi:aminobenzoyl-glutamate utilization protein B